jgi:hypothetical protein
MQRGYGRGVAGAVCGEDGDVGVFGAGGGSVWCGHACAVMGSGAAAAGGEVRLTLTRREERGGEREGEERQQQEGEDFTHVVLI